MPTHIVLTHRAGQESIKRTPWVRIPPLADVVRLYEMVACAAGALSPAPRVVGIALNTAEMNDSDARDAVARTGRDTGLPTTDVVRFGVGSLLDAVLTR